MREAAEKVGCGTHPHQGEKGARRTNATLGSPDLRTLHITESARFCILADSRPNAALDGVNATPFAEL